jgi:hypothetical protein
MQSTSSMIHDNHTIEQNDKNLSVKDLGPVVKRARKTIPPVKNQYKDESSSSEDTSSIDDEDHEEGSSSSSLSSQLNINHKSEFVTFERADSPGEFISFPISKIDYVSIFYDNGIVGVAIVFTTDGHEDEFNITFHTKLEFGQWCLHNGGAIIIPNWIEIWKQVSPNN